MMFNLNEAIKEAGLELISNNKYSDMRLFHADYVYKKNNNIIAKYIFLECTCEEFNKYIYESDEFISKIIEPVFYKLQNDLSWNLYFVCVLSQGEYSKIPIDQKQKFQNNKDYARNIIVSADRFGKEIPAGRPVWDNRKINLVNPAQEWYEILRKDELQFCLNEYNYSYFNKYVQEGFSGYKSDYEIMNVDVDADANNNLKLQQIESLYLSASFREWIFGKDQEISFSKVNLLSGPNGSGKTSILHAIENVLTGKVRVDASKKSNSGDCNKCYISYTNEDNGNNKNLLFPHSSNDKKSREQSWYKKNKSYEKNMLNENFHIYNCFSVEEVFVFGYQGQQHDYADYFSRILFGNHISNTQENLDKYIGKFQEKEKEFKYIKEEKEKQIEKYKDVQQADKSVLVQKMEKAKIIFMRDDSLEHWNEQVLSLQASAVKVEDLKDMLYAEDVVSEISRVNKESVEIKIKMSKHEEKIKKQQADIEQKTTILESIESDIEKKEIQEKQYSKEIAELDDLEIILANYHLLEAYEKNMNLCRELSEKVGDLNDFYGKYSELLKFNGSYLEISNTVKKLDSINNEIKKEKQELKNIEKEIQKLNEKKERVKSLVSAIRSYGKNYIEAIESFDGCPLCGNQKISFEDFKKFIDIESVQDDEDLYGKIKDYEKLKSTIEKNKEFSKNNNIFYRYKEIADEAMSFLKNGNVSIETESLKYIKDLLQLCKDMNEYQVQLIKNFNEIGIFDIEKYTIENYFHDQEKSIQQTALPKKERMQRHISLLKEKKINLYKELSALRQKKKKEQSDLRDCSTNKQKLEQDKAFLKNESKRIFAEMNELERLKVFFSEVSPLLQDGLRMISHKELLNQCNELIKVIKEFCDYEKAKDDINKCASEIKEINEKIKRCVDACQKIKGLKKDDVYAEEFINENISTISNIFCCLHMPKEFEKLALEDNRIIGVRAGKNIKISSMSTGQRTAVVLSVFLALHNAMKTAPQFILLDEPVANIDDLNVIALLDFLREMVVEGNRQIFFTTANYNVRRLFKRKFSFLETEGFKEFLFARENNLKALITEKQYDHSGILSEKQISFL